MGRRIYLLCVVLVSVLAINSCDGLFSGVNPEENINYFQVKLNIENPQKYYHLDDSIVCWLEVPEQLTDVVTGDSLILENSTFIFNGLINFIYQEKDTLEFLEDNFSLNIEEGELESTGILDYKNTQYSLVMRYGNPDPNRKLRFGIIPHFPGYFSFEAAGQVYFGPERTDPNDFSMANSVGILTHNFNIDDINQDVFMEIPEAIRLNYTSVYSQQAIDSNLFFFFKVTD